MKATLRLYTVCRLGSSIDNEEDNERRRFLDECNIDPSLRDKLSILSRTFQNRRKVSVNHVQHMTKVYQFNIFLYIQALSDLATSITYRDTVANFCFS